MRLLWLTLFSERMRESWLNEARTHKQGVVVEGEFRGKVQRRGEWVDLGDTGLALLKDFVLNAGLSARKVSARILIKIVIKRVVPAPAHRPLLCFINTF